MVMYRPEESFLWEETVLDIAYGFKCDERTSKEVLQYAKVLTAKNLPFDYMLVAVTKYAKVRGTLEWS